MSSAAPIAIASPQLDLSLRFRQSTTIVASPAAASETIICSLTLPKGLTFTQGVLLEAVAAFTVGTSGTNSNLRIRQTDTSGTVLYATGALATAAGTLQNLAGQGTDTAPAQGQVYVVTLTVTAGAATSTVSAACLFATVV